MRICVSRAQALNSHRATHTLRVVGEDYRVTSWQSRESTETQADLCYVIQESLAMARRGHNSSLSHLTPDDSHDRMTA